ILGIRDGGARLGIPNPFFELNVRCKLAQILHHYAPWLGLGWPPGQQENIIIFSGNLPVDQYRNPFNNPGMVGHELKYMADALQRGHSAGNGIYTKRCQQFLERELGAPKVLLTTSCTDALELAALLLDLQTGDEVILPSFTFVSTANAFVLRGAVPVFV